MTRNEVDSFIDLIDDKDLLQILFNMNNYTFIETLKKYNDTKGFQLTKK